MCTYVFICTHIYCFTVYIYRLQAFQRNMWKDKVTVVSCDMRDWNPPEKADIIVSELLGSFGDNELSPECLDNVMKFLRGLYCILYYINCAPYN